MVVWQWRGDSRRLPVFHVVAWGLAAFLSLLPVLFDSVLRSGRFWGIWLYAGAAASVLIHWICARWWRGGNPLRDDVP